MCGNLPACPYMGASWRLYPYMVDLMGRAAWALAEPTLWRTHYLQTKSVRYVLLATLLPATYYLLNYYLLHCYLLSARMSVAPYERTRASVPNTQRYRTPYVAAATCSA